MNPKEPAGFWSQSAVVKKFIKNVMAESGPRLARVGAAATRAGPMFKKSSGEDLIVGKGLLELQRP